jgi:hypothetical protein
MVEPGASPSENPDFAGHCLLRLATLSGALTGGGIYLLTDWTMGTPFRISTGMCLASFALASLGLARRGGVTATWGWFKASAALLFAGLSTALIGIVFR